MATAVSAVGGVRHLRSVGLKPVAVSGVVSLSPLAVNEAEAITAVKIFKKGELMSADVADGIAASVGKRRRRLHGRGCMNNRFPSLYADNRGRLAVAIVFFLTLQAVAMGIGAFATRSIFSGLHSNANESLTISLSILIGAGFIGAFGRLSANTLAERLGQSFAISFRRNFFSHLSSLAKR